MTKSYSDIRYPGVAMTDSVGWRFNDKDNQESERLLFSNFWREQINQFGTKVNYFVNTYNLLSADNVYGEEPNKTFADPREIVIAATLNDNAITLSQFGFQSDDEVTAYVHISSFEATFSTLSALSANQYVIEPKAGDVFQLSEFGNDRPNDRQAKYFEITQKLDESIGEMNQLGGHYVFQLKAKRLDYSFEPNIPFDGKNENISGNDQVFEGSLAGRLSGGANQESIAKKENYDQYDIDNESKNNIFDMGQNDTDVYGDYY